MKRVLLSSLVPGMVTAEDVYSYNNRLIVAKNTPLTDNIITRLEFFSIMSIRIDDSVPIVVPATESESSSDVSQAATADPTASHGGNDLTFSERIKQSEEYKQFKANFEESIGDLKNSINDIVEKNAPIDTASVFTDTVSLLQGEGSTFSFFNMLHNMRDYDDLTYAHCMNVALICNVFAGWLHMSQEDVEIATLSGLFHDIGKLAIPDNIIKKPDRLTDEEYRIIKTHTVEGYNILKKQDINEHIKLAALMHHERCDGGGYPLGVSAEKIDRFAKIVAIADVYDAMTAARVYRGPLCPFTVIEIFEKEGLQRYETEYILCFLENVVLTYMNNRVKLSDGREGDIVFLNKQALSKPMVNCSGTFVDLSKEKNLSIVELL